MEQISTDQHTNPHRPVPDQVPDNLIAQIARARHDDEIHISQLNELKALHEKTQHELQLHQSQSALFQYEISNANSERDLLKDALAKAREQISTQRSEFIRKEQETFQQILELKTINNLLNQKLEFLQQQLENEQHRFIQATTREKQTENQYNEIVERLEHGNKQLSERVKAAEKKIRELQAHIQLEEARQTHDCFSEPSNAYSENPEATPERNYSMLPMQVLYSLNLDFEQIVAKLYRTKRKKKDAEERNALLEEQLNMLLGDIEEKAPMYEQQKQNYEKLIIAYNELMDRVDGVAGVQREDYVQELEQQLSKEKNDKDAAQKECTYLTGQVQALLLETHHLRTGGSPPTSDPNLYRNVEELLAQNSSLRREVQDADQRLQRNYYAQQLTDLEEENQRLMKEIDKLKRIHQRRGRDKLESFYYDKKSEIWHLRQRLVEVTSDAKFYKERVQQLQIEIDALRTERDDLHIRLLENSAGTYRQNAPEGQSSHIVQELIDWSNKLFELQIGQIEPLPELQMVQMETLPEIMPGVANDFLINLQQELTNTQKLWSREVTALKIELENAQARPIQPVPFEMEGLRAQNIELLRLVESLRNDLKESYLQIQTVSQEYSAKIQEIQKERQLEAEQFQSQQNELIEIENSGNQHKEQITFLEQELESEKLTQQELLQNLNAFQGTMTEFAQRCQELQYQNEEYREEIQNLKQIQEEKDK